MKGRVDKVEEFYHEPRLYDHVPDLLRGVVSESGVLLLGEELVFDDVVIDADESVDGVVVDLRLLAMLNGKLEHLDSPRVIGEAFVKNDCFEPVELGVLFGETTQTGETTVAVDDETVGENNRGLTLIEGLDVLHRGVESARVALDDKLLDDFIVGLAVGAIGEGTLLGLVTGNPRGDAVVLDIVVQQVELDAIDLVRLGHTVDG